MIASSARAYAALQGRNYVIPDDVKSIALPALRAGQLMKSSQR